MNNNKMGLIPHGRSHTIGPERLREFMARGYKQRHFFPHRILYLPRPGPDGLKASIKMCGIEDPESLWEVLLFAEGSVLEKFPSELFFDDDIIWHQRQVGITGHVAFSNLVCAGHILYSNNHVSDVVQRISRRRQHKTQIEKRFQGWAHMLLNAVFNFACRRKMTEIRLPTAEWMMRNTDPTRSVKKELFERIYDRTPNSLFKAERIGNWWVINIAANKDRLVRPVEAFEPLEDGRTICLCHDIEYGLGHFDVEPDFAASCAGSASSSLDQMLEIEEQEKISATYNVVATLLNDLRARIEARGHCLAFHSYDHDCSYDSPAEQLAKCREIDYRLKGYRPPRSIIAPELADDSLCFHNFEWLASSAASLGLNSPKLERRVVKIPILFDDFPLHQGKLSYKEWESRAFEIIKENDFVAFSLHDCYAKHWIEGYSLFLRRLKTFGRLKTLEQAANEVFLSQSD